MRVTNEVRVYIDKKVNAVIAAKTEFLRAAQAEEERKVKEARNRYADTILPQLKALLGKDKITVDVEVYNEGCKWGTATTVRYDEIQKEISEIRNFYEAKRDDILIDLALGGTKADLDALLSEITA